MFGGKERASISFCRASNVFHEFVSNVFHAGYVFFYPKGVFDTVEAGKSGIFRTVFEVVFTRIDDGVEFAEKLGNRFDTFVMDAGGGKQGFGLFNVAGFNASVKVLVFATSSLTSP